MLPSYHLFSVNIILLSLLGIGLLVYKYRQKKINLLFLIVIISILPTISLLRNGTYESGNLTMHANYLMGYYENLKDGILIPEWAGKLCYGYGCPIYIFLYKLPLHIASVFHFMGFSYINSIKLLLALSYVSSGITMYFWARDEFKKIPAFAVSIFYIFTPYQLIDLHFRISPGETLSFVFIPLVFLFTKKIIDKREIKYIFFGSIALSGLILSHLGSFIAIIHILFLYGLTKWYLKKERKIIDLIYLSLTVLIAILLTTFYYLPALSEVKYTYYSNSSKEVSFTPLIEYIFSPARYGFLFQDNDGKSYLIIGYAHLIVILLSLFLLIKNEIKVKDKTLLFFFLVTCFALLFLTQTVSKPIWELLFYLKGMQFSSRLLVPIAFVTSALAGILASRYNNKYFIIFLCTFTILSTILNWGNRKIIPENINSYKTAYDDLYTEYIPDNNPESMLKDYNNARIYFEILSKQRKTALDIVSGSAELKQVHFSSTKHQYIVLAKTHIILRENTNYFPGWQLKINNVTRPLSTSYNQKQITFSLEPGLYTAELEFTNTPIRTLSKRISFYTLICICIFGFILLLKKNSSYNNPLKEIRRKNKY